MTSADPANLGRASRPRPAQHRQPPPPHRPCLHGPASAVRRFDEVARITGGLTPKSIVAAPTGYVVAQNMIYTHTVSVYDQRHQLVTTIPDQVTPSDFGYGEYTKPVRGGPVEASFSPDGEHVWVSNYSRYGPGFSKPGDDVCSPASKFLYVTLNAEGTVSKGTPAPATCSGRFAPVRHRVQPC